MSAYIHAIETAVPQYSYQQEELRDLMKTVGNTSEKQERLIHMIYNRSGINTRYSVVDDFRSDSKHNLFFNGHGAHPGTKNRNEVYIREGRKLFVEVAKKLINNSNFSPDEITHLITVSCTGFYAPGPDYDIIKSVGLDKSIQRYHLGFMGCYAVIPGLKMAEQFCKADKNANVLVISTELCTIHFQGGNKTDDLVSSSVFADGAAGVIISSKKPANKTCYKIDSFASSITEKGKDDMAWVIGDTGFNMVLSSYVPQILSDGLEPFLTPILNKHSLKLEDIDLWGVHPGGRAILDKVEQTLQLDTSLLSASRTVLADYGNMSSATVLFVLKELLELPSDKQQQKTLALAFGPGLTIESALLTKIT